jgi:hypothetical protein
MTSVPSRWTFLPFRVGRPVGAFDWGEEEGGGGGGGEFIVDELSTDWWSLREKSRKRKENVRLKQ